jgi:hypothetical protein
MTYRPPTSWEEIDRAKRNSRIISVVFLVVVVVSVAIALWVIV